MNMTKWYSLKYQEQKIRDFIKKYKNWLDYSDMVGEHYFRIKSKGECVSVNDYCYNKNHELEYLRELIHFKDKFGIHPFGFINKTESGDCRILLCIDDKYYKFTDARFDKFVECFIERNKKTK